MIWTESSMRKLLTPAIRWCSLCAIEMNTAFIKLHQPTRVSGRTAAWQRCSLDFGTAGKDF